MNTSKKPTRPRRTIKKEKTFWTPERRIGALTLVTAVIVLCLVLWAAYIR